MGKQGGLLRAGWMDVGDVRVLLDMVNGSGSAEAWRRARFGLWGAGTWLLAGLLLSTALNRRVGLL